MKVSSVDKERLLMAGAWVMVYASAPLYIYYIDSLKGFDFDSTRLYSVWGMTILSQ